MIGVGSDCQIGNSVIKINKPKLYAHQFIRD